MMFLLTCDKKLTKSQLSPTHASTKRKITDENLNITVYILYSYLPLLTNKDSPKCVVLQAGSTEKKQFWQQYEQHQLDC